MSFSSVCKKAVFLLAISPLLVAPVNSFAGNESSGGGDILILPDDRIILADPFVVRPGKPMEFHPTLKEELLRAGEVLEAFGAENTFLSANVLNPYVEYRYATGPLDCRRVELGGVPAGGEQKLVACTEGHLTLISEPDFRKMTIREQAKLIIHERLRALKVAAPGSFIADVTDGVELGLEIMNSQLRGNERVTLSDHQLDTLNLLMRRIVQLELGAVFKDLSGNLWKIVRNGAGVASAKADIHPSATLGLGSVLGPNSMLGEESVALRLRCWGRCLIGSGSSFIPKGTAAPTGLRLGSNAHVIATVVDRDVTLHLEDGAMVENAELRASGNSHLTVHVGPDSALTESEISASDNMASLTIGARSAIRASKLKIASSVEVKTGAALENSEISLRDLSMEAGARIENSIVKGLYRWDTLELESGALIQDTELLVGGMMKMESKVLIQGSGLKLDSDALITVGAAATIKDLRAAIEVNRSYWSGRRARLIIQPGITLLGDGVDQSQDLCGPGRSIVDVGVLRIKSLAQMKKLCSDKRVHSGDFAGSSQLARDVLEFVE